MEQTARVSPLFHWRMLVSVLIMATVDCLGLSLCIRDVLKNGPSMSILFANEVPLLPFIATSYLFSLPC